MQVVFDNLPIVLVLVAGVFAPLTGWFAPRRSRQPVLWFLFGAVLGPVALALLAIAPPGRCPSRANGPSPAGRASAGAAGADHARGEATAWASTPRDADGCTPTATIPLVNAPLDRGAVAPIAAPERARRMPGRTSRAARCPDAPARSRSAASHGAPAAATAGEVLSTGIYLSGNAGSRSGRATPLSRVGRPLAGVRPGRCRTDHRPPRGASRGARGDRDGGPGDPERGRKVARRWPS